MGIVWEAYHKGVTLLVVPETPTDTMHPPENHGRNRKKKERTAKGGRTEARFLVKCGLQFYWKGFSFVSCSVPISEKTETSENSNKNKKNGGTSFCSDIWHPAPDKTRYAAFDFKQRLHQAGGGGPRPLEGRLPGDVIHNDRCRGISNVTRDEAAESFLAKLPDLRMENPRKTEISGVEKSEAPPQKKNRSCIVLSSATSIIFTRNFRWCNVKFNASVWKWHKWQVENQFNSQFSSPLIERLNPLFILLVNRCLCSWSGPDQPCPKAVVVGTVPWNVEKMK